MLCRFALPAFVLACVLFPTAGPVARATTLLAYQPATTAAAALPVAQTPPRPEPPRPEPPRPGPLPQVPAGAPLPEPAVWALLLLGITGTGIGLRRRRLQVIAS